MPGFLKLLGLESQYVHVCVHPPGYENYSFEMKPE